MKKLKFFLLALASILIFASGASAQQDKIDPSQINNSALSNSLFMICNDSSGSGTAQVCSTTPTFVPAAGTAITYKTTTTNTGAVTLAVNGASAAAIQKWQGTALAAGDIQAGIYVCLIFDGTHWQISSLIGNAPSGGSTAFSALTGSTNTTAAMLVGTGASLGVTGSGTIGATTLLGGTWAIPGTIGSTTPSSGAFTTISATGQITSTLGTGTAPFSISSTTVVPNLNASLLGGATFASPGTIGGTSPGAATFTTGTFNTTLTAPFGSNATTTANGQIKYDTTNSNWHMWANGADNYNFTGPVSGTYTNNDCVKFGVSSGTITLVDLGSACGFANPMTTLGDVIYGGASGAPTRLAGPTATNGVAQVLTSTPSGGAAVAPVWSPAGVTPNPQTGTTYTFLATDRAGWVSFSNAASIAVTLPQAGSTGFASNYITSGCDIGAGTATITPTTSTISYTNGSTYTSAATSVALTTGQCITIRSDNTNYFAVVYTGGSAAGGGGFNGSNTYTSAHTANTSDNGKLIIMNCSGACALTLPNPQPSTTWSAGFVSIGATNATIALGSSMTWNETATAPNTPIKWNIVPIVANSATSTDYIGSGPLTCSTGLSCSANSYGTNIAAQTGEASSNTTTRNSSLTTVTFGTFGGNSTNPVLVSLSAYPTTAGVACTGATTVQFSIVYVDENANTVTLNGSNLLMSFTNTHNGGPTDTADQLNVILPLPANLNNSTGIQYSSVYTAGSGCSTNPSYAVWAKVIF